LLACCSSHPHACPLPRIGTSRATRWAGRWPTCAWPTSPSPRRPSSSSASPPPSFRSIDLFHVHRGAR
jgi:hypothetical protein